MGIEFAVSRAAEFLSSGTPAALWAVIGAWFMSDVVNDVEFMVIRVLDLSAVALAATGVVLSFLASRDAKVDLHRFHAAGYNGLADLNTKLHVRTSRAFEVTHVVFGLFALAGLIRPPLTTRYLQAVAFYAAYVGMQLLIIGYQSANMRDRDVLRIKLAARARAAVEEVLDGDGEEGHPPFEPIVVTGDGKEGNTQATVLGDGHGDGQQAT